MKKPGLLTPGRASQPGCPSAGAPKGIERESGRSSPGSLTCLSQMLLQPLAEHSILLLLTPTSLEVCIHITATARARVHYLAASVRLYRGSTVRVPILALRVGVGGASSCIGERRSSRSHHHHGRHKGRHHQQTNALNHAISFPYHIHPTV